MLESYDVFLGMLNDEVLREHIEKLEWGKVYNDDKFLLARENAIRFQDALTNIFLTEKTPLKDFSLKYGIF